MKGTPGKDRRPLALDQLHRAVAPEQERLRVLEDHERRAGRGRPEQAAPIPQVWNSGIALKIRSSRHEPSDLYICGLGGALAVGPRHALGPPVEPEENW